MWLYVDVCGWFFNLFFFFSVRFVMSLLHAGFDFIDQQLCSSV
ncbi:hypothetical protein MANES_04G078834v8 [Manihot esculenta]|uniref:Uncharacterized protein n=1 Tax=Manihot esculenta TaxID=3983 RepID=A0ACB7HV80_MANES|nr:hypothetical protein MANES_04G078834v8 [Manihot esculenta]